ncbi:type II secretion system minor pseudopilin GspK [Microbulbifer sp. 2205BS26-8]|uniref:type II secretion system minor pseudopilin GspK n=1 Tax=Microbulbifer sp. 2205BS26-8 TaxID=3064386 RepID=UPI00273FA4C4|nr:type II secretion system minor pseudopilin GspK [Microbulbifer sp. 2205BS26-8]MDP5209069.1 type II secretion system minor pseudopilin GspK [Microbulbifer sp. 2205BS26-8]
MGETILVMGAAQVEAMATKRVNTVNVFCHQRGVALITVLLVMVIAIAAVTHAITRDQIAITRSGALLANTQLAEFVAGAEAWARVALEKDFEEDKAATDAADHALEAWAAPALQFNPDNGKIRINIKDLNSCFNVNTLRDSSNPNSAEFKIFQRLVRNVTGKSDLARAIADWIDTGDIPLSTGTEDDGYLGREIAHRTPDTLISDISELSVVQGMEAEDWQKLAPFLCALPKSDTLININLAPRELIEAVEPAVNWSKLEQSRESGDILRSTGDLPLYNIRTNANRFDVHSQYFIARIAVQLGDTGDYRQYWETALWLDDSDGKAKVLQRQRRTFSLAMMQELLDGDDTRE